MATQGRYNLIRKIADGGMAEIFLASLEGAQGFKKLVVLKRIRTAFYADPQFRNMLVDEAHIAMSLNHSNIVQVLDLGESAERYFLALELVDGWSTDVLIQRAQAAGLPLPRELALYISLQVCRALSYAHLMQREGQALEIVHRDVSPQNILISEQGEVKLADFGIAKALGRREKTAAGIVKGKIYFMSPEQADAKEVDGRSDLFSLGTVMYFLTTGKLAFQAPTALEALLRIKAADFPSPASALPSIEPEINRLILKAMQLRPEDRYASAEEMLHDVERVLRTAFPPAGQTELQRWLAALRKKDHALPISQAAGPPPDKDEDPVENSWIELSDSAIVPPTLPPRKIRSVEKAPPAPPPTKQRWPWFLLALASALGAVVWLAQPRPPLSPTPPSTSNTTWRPALREGIPVQDAAVTEMTMPDSGIALSNEAVVVVTLPGTDAGSASESEASGPDVADSGETALAQSEAEKPDEAIDDAAEQKLLSETIPDPTHTVIGEEAAAQGPPPTEKPAPASKAQSSKPNPSPGPAKSETVSVAIQSNPPGSVVKLENRVFGKTPINLRFKPDILFELTFVKSGYATTKKRFFVADRPGQKVYVSLKKANRGSPRQR